MRRSLIKTLLKSPEERKEITVEGWVRTRRDSKDFSFLEINDGSCLKNLQIFLDHQLPLYEAFSQVSTGCAVSISGHLTPSPGKGQKWELKASSGKVFGLCGLDYPLQKKGHSLEFLREIAHLRPRSNLFGCIFRIRSRLSFAIHEFFQSRDFLHVHTPIITSNDCEGAGELFRITVSGLHKECLKEDSAVSEFFGKPSYLTVSGQLEGELLATALSNVYTFGPTFRAENSNTARHASEFWMVEPEMAFCDLKQDMALAEEFIKNLVQDVRDKCCEDLELLARFIDKELTQRLDFIQSHSFKEVEYGEALKILEKSGETFEYPVQDGCNLQTEHERYLTEKHFKAPVFVIHFPRSLKPFYMKVNPDGQTVAAMDLLIPRIGEIIGGSQREDNLTVLRENMKMKGLREADYQWYLDTRKFGSVPHSGFGLGFERLLMFVTGMANIRDVIPFARTPGHAEF